jgi:FeS assembly SUF system protein
MEEIDDIDIEKYKQNYIAVCGETLHEGKQKADRETLIEALKTVADPEIAINIWDMGLIYKLDMADNGDVFVEMTVTSPMCPVADALPKQAAEALSQIEGTGKIEVKVVWEPAWDISMMSDEAKALIELF